MASLLVILGVLWGGMAVGQPTIPKPSDVEERAAAFVDLLAAGRFDEAAQGFSEPMKLSLSPAKLNATWNLIGKDFGPFEQRLSTRRERLQEYDVVYVTCQFARRPLDIKVVYDPSRRVAGLFFQPVPAAGSYTAPDYAPVDRFEEVEVAVGADDWTLPGTLTLPLGVASPPAVVLVHGSGPHDRDGSVGPNKPLRDLAWGLAARGIAVLRYEKRTRRYYERLKARQHELTPEQEILEDARRALALLRTESRVDGDCLYAVGHSLGGTLAPLLARQAGGLAGVVTLAGAARPLQEVILSQVAYIAALDGQVEPQEQSRLDALQAQVARVTQGLYTSETSVASLPLGLGPKYWRYLEDYNPVATAAALKTPLMVLHGDRDYQVTLEDWALWEKGLATQGQATLKRYADLNHLFMPGAGQSSPEEYARPAHVAAVVIEDIAAWIKSTPCPNP